MPKQRTMVYRPASVSTDPVYVVETEGGRWQWQIVDLEDGAPAPDGWQLSPYAGPVDPTVETAKPKRGRPKKVVEEADNDDDEALPDEVTDGNGDGN